MTFLQAIFLGLMQGATEFLPISSSGHLVLVPWLLGWLEPNLAFEAMVHWGTLAAVAAFFRRELISLAAAWIESLVKRGIPAGSLKLEAKLANLILLGTIPGALMGYLWEDFFEELFSSPAKVASLLLVTGALLAASERMGKRRREIADLGWLNSLSIGFAQGLAIAPGISRSGATIAAGLLLGLKRKAAAQFSFLLATPIIFGAGLLQLKRLFEAGTTMAQLSFLILGFLTAALSGYFSIRFLLSYLQRGRLYPFAGYCWAVGAACLLIALLRG